MKGQYRRELQPAPPPALISTQILETTYRYTGEGQTDLSGCETQSENVGQNVLLCRRCGVRWFVCDTRRFYDKMQTAYRIIEHRTWAMCALCACLCVVRVTWKAERTQIPSENFSSWSNLAFRSMFVSPFFLALAAPINVRAAAANICSAKREFHVFSLRFFDVACDRRLRFVPVLAFGTKLSVLINQSKCAVPSQRNSNLKKHANYKELLIESISQALVDASRKKKRNAKEDKSSRNSANQNEIIFVPFFALQIINCCLLSAHTVSIVYSIGIFLQRTRANPNWSCRSSQSILSIAQRGRDSNLQKEKNIIRLPRWLAFYDQFYFRVNYKPSIVPRLNSKQISWSKTG